ncbi:leucine-rich repeats and immunoglobulin-like domains protein 2 isoform X2 [Spodoptera frugiperda]|uniref:Leucine-rich repeats and immunoglobulin-like domains protein 2 isoform X2 n=1 Tax=Spodoptera frugiperda TaxID=7108 RepID=A0A9R0EMU7_SPOFR|nr:leucine-rich repeats and immunoglobulin-like domains protein 2 isoform X2 [Spodoptera frugiperda]
MGESKHTHPRPWLFSMMLMLTAQCARTQCPWEGAPTLQAACICAHNLARDLSVQCDQVDFPTLLSALNTSTRNIVIDLLYINNSSIPVLTHNMFANLKIHNLQISGCGIKRIEDDAFRGQGPYLKNLNLQDNELTEVPVKALKILINLSLLDISKNRISHITNHSFITLRKLTTLKVSDNNVTLEPQTLTGLENSLKNLNLKGTKQKTVPECIRGLRSLAFLDLSQNSIRELPGPDGSKTFEGLDSLTALNLERNLIVHLRDDAFAGIKSTLSSLSLLNNLLPEFPTAAIGTLSDLRVLDIGFNLLNKLPVDAFVNNPSITLLALDGNPLPTVPEEAFSHLNQTLRGLSLGGRFLNCDCRLRWIIEWIRNGELQVTSRERNPQFCGNPSHFRERGFYSFEPNELVCDSDISISTTEKAIPTVKDLNEWKQSQATSTTTTTTTSAPPSTTSTSAPHETEISNNIDIPTKPATIHSTSTTSTTSTARPGRIPSVRPAAPTWRHAPHQRPPLVMSFPQQKPKVDDSNEVIVKNAYRQDNSVIIQWDSDVANILGFRVVYRLFGDKSFKQGPPLEASEREFKIKNVPSQECIVVCVISLEEVHVSPETVPYSQCREVRTVSAAASNMDKITIAASAAICGTIVVAVLVFAAASRRRSRTVHRLHTQAPEKMPNPCCGGLTGTPSPSGPLSSLATIGAFGKQHLRQSRQSLGAASERASRLSLSGAAGGATGGTAGSRRRPRSRSRPASRYSVGSIGMGYCDTSDNWTDHDMDIYMARNPTTRSGLVPL